MKKKIISTAAIYFMAMGMFLCAFTQPAKETVLMTMAAIHGHPVADGLEGAKELPKEVQKAIDEHSLKNVWSYYVREETNSVEIRGYHGDEVDVVVPDRIDGMPVTEVIFGAFCYDCENITSVFIPESVVYIGSDVFLGSYKLTNIQISSDNPVYASEDGILYNREKTELICCPRGKQGKITDLPESIESIHDYAFQYCDLTEIGLPENIKTIGENAFEGCTYLKRIEIPESVCSIEKETFAWCCNLESIHIPQSVSRIGEAAFSWCESLADIELSEGVKSIEGSAFAGCGMSEIKLPGSLEHLEEWAFGRCPNLADIRISPDHSLYESQDGILYNKGKKQLVVYPSGRRDEIVELPEGLESIGPSAFSGSEKIRYVKLPEGLSSIGSDAFFACENLVGIEFPREINKIEDCAFLGCVSLTDVILPEGLENLNRETFAGCKKLVSVEIPEGINCIGEDVFSLCEKLSKIKLPESLKRIEAGAFSYCTGLEQIEIPQEIEYIGEYAFRDCDNLKDVYYPKDKNSWDKNSIENHGNEDLENAYIHFNETMT